MEWPKNKMADPINVLVFIQDYVIAEEKMLVSKSTAAYRICPSLQYNV